MVLHLQNFNIIRIFVPQIAKIQEHTGKHCLDRLFFIAAGGEGQGDTGLLVLDPDLGLCTQHIVDGGFGHGNNGGNGSIKTDGLDILDFYSVADTSNRYNGFFLGECDGGKITAFNSRFSHSYPGKDCVGFAKVLRGQGLNKDCPYEGIVKNNFVGTYLLGPLLILNPLYTASLMKKLGSNDKPAFFEDSMNAYKRRLDEFNDEKRKLD